MPRRADAGSSFKGQGQASGRTNTRPAAGGEEPVRTAGDALRRAGVPRRAGKAPEKETLSPLQHSCSRAP